MRFFQVALNTERWSLEKAGKSTGLEKEETITGGAGVQMTAN